MQDLTMDFIVGLPPSINEYGQAADSILVVVDRFTKYSRYYAVQSTIDAPKLADLFMREIIRDFGVPRSIVTDRGSLFTSKF